MTNPTPTRAPARTPKAGWRGSRTWRYGRWVAAAGVVGLLAAVAAVGVLYATVELPDEAPRLESSTVLAADGTELAVFAKDERRFEVPLADISEVTVDALIAAEDRRFYEHSGVDPAGVLRAVWNNVRGNNTQGGSTITQQLIKNAYGDDAPTMTRKVREALLAAKLEGREDKDEILETYLNTVYFGRGAYGIEAAAQTYFGTTAAELNAPQAALLVALLRAPESTDPDIDAEKATDRRNGVLAAMVEMGTLERAEADDAKAAELGALPRGTTTTLSAGVGAHFIEWVRAQAAAELGEAALYGDGLTIHTTLDVAHQQAAEAAIAGTGNRTAANAALISIDANGSVTAHVGSRDHNTVAVDLARGVDGGGTGRQAGSTFKPFVLAAALSSDAPVTLASRYPAPGTATFPIEGAATWEVSNYGGTDHGVVDLAEATSSSINTVYARVALDATPEAVAATAANAGITSTLDPQPAIALGSAEVSPLELAVAYNTFGQDGRRVTAHTITKITRDDTTIWEPDLEPADDAEPAIDPGVAAAVTHALTDVIASGTGAAAAIDRPAAGKTGTTQNSGDAWFAGYTPHRSTVVWYGHPEGPGTPAVNADGTPITGGGLPAETWAAFMAAATADDDPTEFTDPPELFLVPPPSPERTLTLTPDSGPAGTTAVASGTGYEDCTVTWRVAIDGTGTAPAPDGGSDLGGRNAELTIGDPESAPGDITVRAYCDDGTGETEAATAVFTIEADPDTTTTTPTTTTTSEPPGRGQNPDRTTTTTTTSTTTTTTTTAAPRGGQRSATTTSAP